MTWYRLSYTPRELASEGDGIIINNCMVLVKCDRLDLEFVETTITFTDTVNPVYKNHSRDQKHAVCIDRWSL